MIDVRQLQNRVIGGDEFIPYFQVMTEAYPPEMINFEPFVGLKIYLTDPYSDQNTAGMRLSEIDSELPRILFGTECMLREAGIRDINGLYLVTFPVPRSQFKRMLQNVINVLAYLDSRFGIKYQNMVEISVSGRCPEYATAACLSSCMIPDAYMNLSIPMENTAYRLGRVERLNEEYMLLRSRWKFTSPMDIEVLVAGVSSIYH